MDVVAVLLTYERAELFLRTVESFRDKSGDLPLLVFDDGSTEPSKVAALVQAECDSFTSVERMPRRGLVDSWVGVLDTARTADVENLVLLEDDLVFATGWLDVLERMQGGVRDIGFKPGAMTCFRCHAEAQSEIRDLRGVRAYQSMYHAFQVNMIERAVLDRFDVVEEAAKKTKEQYPGFDIYFLGLLSHRLRRINFCSMESWVGHTGVGNSVTALGGKLSFAHRGYGLVQELQGELGQGG